MEKPLPERRQDIGIKITYAVLAFLLGILFKVTYDSAQRAIDIGTVNGRDIAVLQQCKVTWDKQLEDISKKLDRLLSK